MLMSVYAAHRRPQCMCHGPGPGVGHRGTRPERQGGHRPAARRAWSDDIVVVEAGADSDGPDPINAEAGSPGPAWLWAAFCFVPEVFLRAPGRLRLAVARDAVPALLSALGGRPGFFIGTDMFGAAVLSSVVFARPLLSSPFPQRRRFPTRLGAAALGGDCWPPRELGGCVW